MTPQTSGSIKAKSLFDFSLDGGTYLTDGKRLLRLLSTDGNWMELEDARSLEVEWQPAYQVASIMREVTPHSAG